MAIKDPTDEGSPQDAAEANSPNNAEKNTRIPRWRGIFGAHSTVQEPSSPSTSSEGDEIKTRPEKWNMGILNDKETEEVPGQSSASQEKVNEQPWELLQNHFLGSPEANPSLPSRLRPPNVEYQPK